MIYNLELHDLAEEELWNAVDYYDEKRHRLGKELALELQDFMRTIREHPARFPIVKGGIRKCVLKRFPYVIIFEIKEEVVFVLAIFHSSRNPDVWEERL
jgi:mRNA-degrading endonuclease RelE of RelBE toxin-antitoxin system